MVRKIIPWSMVTARLLLAPGIVLCALLVAEPQPWLGAMIAAAFLSDVFDGILARRWGTATPALRVADSAVDMVFYASVLAAVVIRHEPVVKERIALVVALLVMESSRMLLDFLKYRRMASYHSYASKVWGVLLATASVAVLCFEKEFWLLTAALAWGIVCNAEGIVMTVLLPEWTHDVKTLGRAMVLRRDMKVEESSVR